MLHLGPMGLVITENGRGAFIGLLCLAGRVLASNRVSRNFASYPYSLALTKKENILSGLLVVQTNEKNGFRVFADIVMVLIAITIVFLTLFYAPKGNGPAGADKIYHAVAFFVLVFPGALAHKWSFLWLLPTAVLFGAAIEIAQPYFGRSRELADLYADIAGIMAGMIAGTTVRMWRTR